MAANAAKPSKPATPKTLKDRLKEKEKKKEELEKKLDELREQLQEITQEYQEAYTKYLLTKERVHRNKQKLDESSVELDLNEDKLNKRIVSMYKNNEALMFLNLLLGVTSFDEFLNNLKFMTRVTNSDIELVSKTKTLKGQIEETQLKLEKQKTLQQKSLDEAKTKQNEMKRNLNAQHMLAKLISKDILKLRQRTADVDGLELTIMFPVNGPSSYINDWGFPRSGGRSHKGTDIFAAQGTPAISTVDGVIWKSSPTEKGLGGITVWVYGDDNVAYYYAHLEKLADGMTVGRRVKAGDVVGYVGNTGNARTTPPHLHFQINPGGDTPINPYPYLVAADPYKSQEDKDKAKDPNQEKKQDQDQDQ
ncbi:MAG TPA: hypothetical protein ENH57_00390 [Actinobacteria bacterium]|nr:hypothetical protein [Actinomycetota bacterium]